MIGSWFIVVVFCFVVEPFCLSLFYFILNLNQHTMSKQHAMSRRAGRGKQGACMTKVDGYNNDISLQVKPIIDDWERRMVNEYISRNIDGVSPNHCWIVKNMMELLMEEMLGK